MMLTEGEAFQLWCPFTKRADYERAEDERTTDSHCIASSCMAWRWDAEISPDADREDPFAEMVCVRGHCGLCGKPSGKPT